MTTFLNVKNRATSTLASGIDDAVTSLAVAAGEGAKFPSTYPFHITIEDEVLSCTDRSTDTLTVTRAVEDTSAAAHEAGKTVSLNITAEIVQQLQDHEALSTGVHGVGAGTIGSVSTANKTIYVDKAATGSGTGVDWTNAFTTIQAAVDSIEDVIIHAYTIYVRKGATPYRETVYLNSNPAVNPSHLILGSLLIEPEYYWQADCDTHAVAGEIYDADADFSNVAVGDKVFYFHLAAATRDYEVCTVDDVSQAASHLIGTDGTKTPTDGWKYVIVRTEISGSDDGTDGGTARNYCFHLVGINNVTVNGFYMTFSDNYACLVTNSRGIEINSCIIDNCDNGINSSEYSHIKSYYCRVNVSNYYPYIAELKGYFKAYYVALSAGVSRSLSAQYIAEFDSRYFIIDSGSEGVEVTDMSQGYLNAGTITSAITTGIRAAYNSAVRVTSVTNNATTPTDPASSSDGAYIP